MRIEEYKARIPVVEYIDNFVDVDKFEDYCRECKNWERVWSCPPFKFDPIDYWAQYDRFCARLQDFPRDGGGEVKLGEISCRCQEKNDGLSL